MSQTHSSASLRNWLSDLASQLLPWVSRRIRTSPHWRVGNHALANSHSPETRRLGLLEEGWKQVPQAQKLAPWLPSRLP